MVPNAFHVDLTLVNAPEHILTTLDLPVKSVLTEHPARMRVPKRRTGARDLSEDLPQTFTRADALCRIPPSTDGWRRVYSAVLWIASCGLAVPGWRAGRPHRPADDWQTHAATSVDADPHSRSSDGH